MFMQKRGKMVLICALLLAGCGGGGGGNNSNSNSSSNSNSNSNTQNAPAATDVNTLSALELSNLNAQLTSGQTPGIARWNLPIPVKTNGESRSIAALDAIEKNLGKTIFDRTSIASTADASITRGVIVSVGTACSPAGTPIANNCGNVSSGPNTCAPNAISASREISGRVYLNLDSSDPAGCKASNDVTIHEMKHALGLFAHFDGFGNGPPISDLSWRVLRTVYANPIATPKASVLLAP